MSTAMDEDTAIYGAGSGHGDIATPDRPLITSPEAAAELLVPLLGGVKVEECWALMLDTRHRMMGSPIMISRGSIDHTFMSPREVYIAALEADAAALVLGHNHPSGDPSPSRDDERVTRRLAEAGDLIGIDLLDHMVIGGQYWRSLARLGVMG